MSASRLSPIRLIRCIKNGPEIPGLKDAVIDLARFPSTDIAVSGLLIMQGDSADLSRRLQKNQTSGFLLTGKLNYSLYNAELMIYPSSEIRMSEMHAHTPADTLIAHYAVSRSSINFLFGLILMRHVQLVAKLHCEYLKF
jgi:hypothetical protein